MSNLRQSMTEEEWHELENREPMKMNVNLSFNTMKKLNEMFKTQKEIDEYVQKCIDYMQYLPFEP
jgi:Holliday junction resolvase RusA-like endonuclease